MSRFQDADNSRQRKRSRFDDGPGDSAPPSGGSSNAPSEDALARARAIAERLSSVTSNISSTPVSGTAYGSGLPARSTGGVEVRKKVYVPVLKFPDINFRGLLVGPGGKTHKEMEQKSGAKISIRGKGSQKDKPEVEGEDEMHVLIVGETDDQVRTAEKMVRNILFDPAHAATLKSEQLRSLNGNITGEGSNMDFITAGPNKGPSGLGFSRASDAAPFSLTIEVNDRIVGAIIGRRGETIKDIQTRSHAEIQVEKDSEVEPGSNKRKIKLSGREEDVMYAKKLVEEKIEERVESRSSHYGPSGIVEKLPVDVSVVGLIIGKQGSTIRNIEETSGCKVQIPEETSTDSSKRMVIITGQTEKEVQAAIDEVKKIIDGGGSGASVHKGPSEGDGTFNVPDDKVGLIIGKGGSVIKDLERRTNTKIQIPSTANSANNTRLVSISGTPQAIAWAQQEMANLLAQGSRQSGYGSQSWDSQGASTYNPYWQQWQQYYASMGQGTYQSAPQATSQGAQPAATAVQQAGGAVQHTKEQWDAWREYYAKMGHEIGEYPGSNQGAATAVPASSQQYAQAQLPQQYGAQPQSQYSNVQAQQQYPNANLSEPTPANISASTEGQATQGGSR